MKKADIIIGGGFGDEGKGLFTDYLAARSHNHACVVRFNGGAQAGHTVETPDGKRHVFSHFGSGSLVGLPTFLSAYFVCNPITFLRERAQLLALGVAPEIYADGACPVTTPYDIMINQIAEQARGNHRHGSVGVGFGETLERQSNKAYALCLDDLKNTDTLRNKLNLIRENWTPVRVAALRIGEISDAWKERIASDDIREAFIADASQFNECVTRSSVHYLKSRDHLIFEGAQGLLLDQDRGWFPHVTRSNTGIRNALVIADQAGLENLDVYYLTRSYTTRHGAGPLPHELPYLPYEGIIDQTNRPHAYQGNLRFAWLDVDLFRDTVLRDLSDAPARFVITRHLAMSCLDQIIGQACHIENGELCTTSTEDLLDVTARKIGAQNILASYGPTRATIAALPAQPASRQVVTDIGNGLFKPFNIVEHNIAAAQA